MSIAISSLREPCILRLICSIPTPFYLLHLAPSNRPRSFPVLHSSSVPPPPRSCLEPSVKTDLSFSEFPWNVTNLFHCTFFFFFWPQCAVFWYGVSVPPPGIELGPQQCEHLNTRLLGKSLSLYILISTLYYFWRKQYGFFLLITCKLLENRLWIWFISVSPVTPVRGSNI